MQLKSFFQQYKISIRVIMFFLIPFLCFVLYLNYILKTSLPSTTGTLVVNGISERITINRDKNSIPHIQAVTNTGAYFGLGFVHAQDRLWQMEMNRRKVKGRLSEVLGRNYIDSDTLMLTLGLYEHAEKIWKNFDGFERSALQSYVDGVNAGRGALKNLPPEFMIYGFEPTEWTAVDSLGWMLQMSFDYSKNLGNELTRSLLVQSIGMDKTNQILPPVEINLNSKNNPQLKTYSQLGFKKSQEKLLNANEYVGSNSWVISGKYSKTNAPILVNDPHLANSIPSVWYLAKLSGESLNVVGATFPGLPFVIIGRNKDIAWGITNMMADTQDVFFEKINPLNQNQYLFDGEYLDMKVSTKMIQVKSDLLREKLPDYKVIIRKTIHGPLISDITGLRGFPSYSLKWAGFEENGGSFRGFLYLNYASDWSEFNAALKDFVAPIHNFVYADREGNIGQLAPGYYPLRTQGSGSLPIDGWNAENLWKGHIPYSDIPRTYNPPSGFIVAANNNIISENYPYYITDDWAPSYRADKIKKEITNLISGDGQITITDMKNLQGDVTSPLPEELLNLFKNIKTNSQKQQEVVNQLKLWDGKMRREHAAPTIVSIWLFHLNRLLLEDDLSNDVVSKQASASLSLLASRINQSLVEQVFLKGKREFCDYLNTEKKETCDDILIIALDHTINELTKEFGEDPEDWLWGEIHQSQYSHFPMSSRENIYHYFFHRKIENGGGNDSINIAPISFNKTNRYGQFFGPGYRQIVDMSGADTGLFMQSTGQSGNPISQYYDNLLKKHRDIEYMEMSLSGSQDADNLLILEPKQN